jgi:hypothetical protein
MHDTPTQQLPVQLLLFVVQRLGWTTDCCVLALACWMKTRLLRDAKLSEAIVVL